MISVVILGRPNVGKSTLFNKLLGKRRALVHDLPGVTRDRLIEQTQWIVGGHTHLVELVDTGGMGGESFSKEIEFQVKTALKNASLAIWLLDAQSGVHPEDLTLIRRFRKEGLLKHCPVVGVVNKIDHDQHEGLESEFYELGLEPILSVSAEHNRGLEELKELILELTNKPIQIADSIDSTEDYPKIAVVGKPNVGKSTLINALLGDERMIVSPQAGTTIDSIDTNISLGDKTYTFIDTAGIRRKSKTEQGVEVLSILQTKKTLERCDIALFLLDGGEGIFEQDEKIGGLIEECGCSVILLVNKWDKQKTGFTQEEAHDRIRKQMAFLRYAPLAFISAEKKQGLEMISELIEEVLDQNKVKIQTHEFTEWVRKEAPIHNPKGAKFYLCHQASRHPPTFVCHVNDPKKIHFSLKRHLVNAIRTRWGYMGSPIRLNFLPSKKHTSR